MSKLILQRLLLLIPTLWGVATLVFLMLALSPGNPAVLILGERASPQALERLREELGLNRPVSEQYFEYLGKVVRFDLGTSIKTQTPVVHEVFKRMPATVELSILSLIYALFFGILFGVLAARYRGRFWDYFTMGGSLVGISMPVFWLGLVLIISFSLKIPLFPTSGRISTRLFFEPVSGFLLLDSFIHGVQFSDFRAFWSSLLHIILPIVALGSIPLAVIARTTRGSMLEVLKSDYIKTARSIGYSELTITMRYALRNALLPIITVAGLQFGLLLAGAILTETIFSWPGMGRWLYNAISARDYPAVQGGVLTISVLFILINLLVDIVYIYINPKVRFS